MVLIEGEAGIGKTRLVDELLARLRDRGAVVLRAGAYEGETHLPYRPVVDVLRDRLHQDAGWVRALDGPVLADAARLVPDLLDSLPEGRRAPAPGATDEPGAEVRFLSALWDTLTAASSGSVPGVLVLDDAQWADEATQRLLAFGLRRLRGRPLMLRDAVAGPSRAPGPDGLDLRCA